MAALCLADADDAALEAIGVRRVDLREMDWAPWAAAAETVSPLLAAQDDDGQPHANDLLELNYPAGEVLKKAPTHTFKILRTPTTPRASPRRPLNERAREIVSQ